MKTLHSLLLALLLALAASTSYARDTVSFSLSLGYPAYYPPDVVYYSPPPPVVYYEPGPVYYPYYSSQAYFSYYDRGDWGGHRHWRRHAWRDHDRHEWREHHRHWDRD